VYYIRFLCENVKGILKIFLRPDMLVEFSAQAYCQQFSATLTAVSRVYSKITINENMVYKV